MKRILASALAAGLLCTALADDSLAGGPRRGDRGRPERTEKTEADRVPRRFDKYPSMNLFTGTLYRDGYSGWKVDGMPVALRRDCVLFDGGLEPVVLDEGRQVVVTGVWREGTIEAYGLTVLPITSGLPVENPDVKIKPSDTDPTVGEIISRPY